MQYKHAFYAPMRNRVRKALEDRKTLQTAVKLPRIEIFELLYGLSSKLIHGSFVSVGAMVKSVPGLKNLLLVHENETEELRKIGQLGQ